MPSLEPILTAILVEAMLESTLHGLYSFLFMTVAYLFWVKPAPKRGPRLYLFAAIVLQYLISTTHWICAIFYTHRNFVILGGGLPAVLAAAEGDVPGEPLTILLTLSGFVAQLFAVHRVSVVWKNKHTMILFPSLLILVYIVTTAIGITFVIRGNAANYPLITTSTVLVLVVNGYSTALIAWKIWRINSASIPADTGRTEKTLMAIVRIVTESYAIQTTIELCMLISFILGSFVGALIFNHLAPPVFGIANLLIHARIGLGWAREPNPERKTEASTVVFRANPTASGLESVGEEMELQKPGQDGKSKRGQGI
ncbi:hypothetical protein MVEN_02582100 [Mycena venus]|uniref:Uncharacterized protein n=1 Tax=Mycena venus TaxID=2733690 RepID=A0A8H6WRB0_9AGAR|nr:hypothetical protein MVEN_02582100 [Mycena venus]